VSGAGMLLSQGSWAPSHPIIFGTSYMRAHSMRNDNQILHGDQTRCEENFYMVDHVRMRTRDLFAVAKLLERIAIAFNFREPI